MTKYWFTSVITWKLQGRSLESNENWVTLNLVEWDTFNQSFVDIDCKGRRLLCKNEQVESPPSGIKRDCAFGGEDQWVHGENSKMVYNWYNVHVSNWVHVCLYFSLDYNDEGTLLDQYGNGVGMAAFEWFKVSGQNYRHSTWIVTEDWVSDAATPILN